MDMLWRFLVYDAMPLIAIAVALGAAVRIIMVLGLRSDVISGVLDQQAPATGLHSTLTELRGISPKAPEFGLVELGSIGEPSGKQIVSLLGLAEAQFRRRIRLLELWTSASEYVTGALLFITLIYAASALRSLTVGLSLEVEHNTTAILDVIGKILAVVFRSTWVVLCLFVVNTLMNLRISRRKERWVTFANQLTREVVE